MSTTTTNTPNLSATTQGGAVEMGPQSQRRLSLQQRGHRLAASNTVKKRKGDQTTLFGGIAFNPSLHCVICKARANNSKEPHERYHPKCWNNKRTRGKSKETLRSEKEERDLQRRNTAQLTNSEKADKQHTNPAAVRAFLAPTPKSKTKMNSASNQTLSGDFFCETVASKLKESKFLDDHKRARVPLAMLAFADAVVKNILLTKKHDQYFQGGLLITVPWAKKMYSHPQYHAIVGQRLYLVDWCLLFDLEINCPCCQEGRLVNERTNFSKNKILFPVFEIDGPPSWCVIKSMKCDSCRANIQANDGRILATIPACAAVQYPVDSHFAVGNRKSHISRAGTQLLDQLMLTHGNGDLVSRMLYNVMNRAYLHKCSSYYSHNKGKIPPTHIEKDGQFITCYPPSGEAIRDLYDESCNNQHNPWRLSDNMRHTREIQGVTCRKIFAEDHTHEVTKNYLRKRSIGAFALWDVATETGEIATAVIVPSTKVSDLSHAAIQLTKRPNFAPKIMCSDRWPVKDAYWTNPFGPDFVGRLGLFHFQQRIVKTLRKRHVDYCLALKMLLEAIYVHNEVDYELVLQSLRDGTMNGKKHTEDEIADLQEGKQFRKRYSKYLRKEIRPPASMRQRLDDWFVRFKVNASAGARPAQGRLDPITREPLFTADTKTAIENCKEKAEYLQDPLRLEQMCTSIAPHPESSHGLVECLSERGESNLEAFHGLLSHFANSGMRESLADNLNLAGTARYNLAVRLKRKLAAMSGDPQQRRNMPALWESVVSYYNHCELQHANELALAAGATRVPFPHAEKLVEDTGERFFSQYLRWLQRVKPPVSDADLCLCGACATFSNSAPVIDPPIQNNNTNETGPPEPVQAPAPPTQVPLAPQLPPPPQIAAPRYLPTPLLIPNFAWCNPCVRPFASWNSFCCPKYREYCFRVSRIGRPPHNDQCRFKAKPSNSQR